MFITQDGSPILYNEEYQEYYRSKSGAIEESMKKFVEPCRIRELAKKGSLRILDIGFGLGYNAISAIDAALEENPECVIDIISLEKDRDILEKIMTLKPELKHYSILSKLEQDPITSSFHYEDKNIFLKIIIGDATDSVKKLKQKFHAVFLDPFSPKRNPELWTESFLKDVYSLMKNNGILATYSYAKHVRETLKACRFSVSDGPIVGRRSPSTVAVKML